MEKTSTERLALTRRDAMRGGLGTASLLALGGGAAIPAAVSTASLAVATGPAQARPCGPRADLTQPDTGLTMHPGYARAIAQTAYVWGWPMVNMINRRAAITQAPHPGHLNGVLPAAPRGQIAMLADYIEPSETFVTCPNQDVVYGLGFFSLDEEPVVIQVPDFGDRFWVYALYDARTDQFGHIGKPYGSKPGFYLLAGPRWNGLKPSGITEVVRCSTELANAIPRVFQDDTPEDKKAIQSVINQVVAYPLKEFDGTMKTIEWAKVPDIPGPKSTGGETKNSSTSSARCSTSSIRYPANRLSTASSAFCSTPPPGIRRSRRCWSTRRWSRKRRPSIHSSSGSTTGSRRGMAGTVQSTTRSSVSTTSTGAPRRNRTCSRTAPTRRSISTPTSTAPAHNFRGQTPMRSRSPRDRSRRSTASGR